MNDYQSLWEQSKKIRILESIAYLLEWDQETYMPKKGALVRADQQELMASLIHKERTSDAFVKPLSKLIDLKTGKCKGNLSKKQQAALREWRRDYLLSAALPNDFVREFAKLTTASITVWNEAKKENAFSKFQPYLQKIIEMSRQKAEYLGYDDHPYDALLDLFEPEMTTKKLVPLFSKLKTGIVEILHKIQNRPQVNDVFLHGKFSTEKQLAFGRFILEEMGYEPDKGRLDLSSHPFSMSLHPFDSRVTTRVQTTSIFDCLSAVMHEGGHSLYEMGLNPDEYGNPLCESISLGIHESQSKLWETRVGQSKAFWKHYLPYFKKSFPKLKNVKLEAFYKAINKVEPSFIRVESDEVTYSLHVILRFELEKRLIEGSLSAGELPQAWNQLMREYLGITPPNDREGCLQDIHWSMGMFGYFPTYALGNLYASQIFLAFEKDYPDWESKMSKGQLLFLRDWLGKKIHRFGKYYRPLELIKSLSKKNLSESDFLNYLTQKYRKIYGFK